MFLIVAARIKPLPRQTFHGAADAALCFSNVTRKPQAPSVPW
ncbi:hypothetical protein [Xanthomonas prunicola]|nr:hypothetical protein [Xanthomonas prunicola]